MFNTQSCLPFKGKQFCARVNAIQVWPAVNFHSKFCIWDQCTEKRRYSTSSDTVYCSICSPQIYVSWRLRARGGTFVIGFIDINKYTSASENVHLCLRSQLGHISVATGSIPSLFCDQCIWPTTYNIMWMLILPRPLEKSYGQIELCYNSSTMFTFTCLWKEVERLLSTTRIITRVCLTKTMAIQIFCSNQWDQQYQ